MGQDPDNQANTPAKDKTFLAWVLLFAVSGLVSLPFCYGTIHGALLGVKPYSEARIEGDQFPKKLIDPAGYQIELPKPPQRILSATMTSDDMLSELIDTKRLVAVTAFAFNPNYSNCADKLPKDVPRFVHLEAERMLELQPDLVIMDDFSDAETVRLLIGCGIPIIRFSENRSFESMFNNISTLGKATGSEAKADAFIAQLRQRIAAVENRVKDLPKPRVLYYSFAGSTSGKDTMIDEMIVRGGGINIAAEIGLTGVRNVSLETAISLRPEVIIVSEDIDEVMGASAKKIKNDPKWATVPAVKTARVYGVPGRWMVCLSQYTINGLEAVSKVLHPKESEQ